MLATIPIGGGGLAGGFCGGVGVLPGRPRHPLCAAGPRWQGFFPPPLMRIPHLFFRLSCRSSVLIFHPAMAPLLLIPSLSRPFRFPLRGPGPRSLSCLPLGRRVCGFSPAEAMQKCVFSFPMEGPPQFLRTLYLLGVCAKNRWPRRVSILYRSRPPVLCCSFFNDQVPENLNTLIFFFFTWSSCIDLWVETGLAFLGSQGLLFHRLTLVLGCSD